MLGIKRQPATRSVIGAGMRVQGPCTFSDGLQIDGEVLGDVTAEGGQPSVLVIGEGGSVQGAISADHVVIGGTVVGPVLARELLELQSKARVQGLERDVSVSWSPASPTPTTQRSTHWPLCWPGRARDR